MSFSFPRKARARIVVTALATAFALVPGARPAALPQLLNLGP